MTISAKKLQFWHWFCVYVAIAKMVSECAYWPLTIQNSAKTHVDNIPAAVPESRSCPRYSHHRSTIFTSSEMYNDSNSTFQREYRVETLTNSLSATTIASYPIARNHYKMTINYLSDVAHSHEKNILRTSKLLVLDDFSDICVYRFATKIVSIRRR